MWPRVGKIDGRSVRAFCTNFFLFFLPTFRSFTERCREIPTTSTDECSRCSETILARSSFVILWVAFHLCSGSVRYRGEDEIADKSFPGSRIPQRFDETPVERAGVTRSVSRAREDANPLITK